MASWFAKKRVFGSSVLMTMTLSQLINCAPQSKPGDPKSSAPVAKSDSPEIKTTPDRIPTRPRPELKVDDLKFSTLETMTSRPSAKAVLKSIQSKLEVDPKILAMALIELHLVAEGRGASSDEQIAKLEKISKISEELKLKSVEDLKRIYAKLEKLNGSKIRHRKQGATLDSLLEKNESHNYSATTLMALLWLTSPTFDASKGLVLIEDGELKLAELRQGQLVAIHPETLGEVGHNLGALEAYASSEKKKVISLPLFAIHEALKKYALDPKAWALRIQMVSNQVLGLKDDDKKMPNTSVLAASGAKGLEYGEINIGEPKDLPEGEIAEEKLSSAPGGNQSREKIDIQQAPLVPAKLEKLASLGVEFGSAKTPVDPKALANSITLNSACFERQDLLVRVAQAIEKSEKQTSLGLALLNHFLLQEAQNGKGLLVAQISQLKKMGLLEKFKKSDLNLVAKLEAALMNGGRTSIPSAVVLSFDQGKLVGSEIAIQYAEDVKREGVGVVPEIVDLMVQMSRDLMGDDTSSLFLVEGAVSCNLSGG